MSNYPSNLVMNLLNNIRKVMVGKDEAIELALIALLCRGHILIEDVPGVGKTTLAAALAKSLDCSFTRIQFTPDVMPSDITGYSMVNMQTGETEFHKGSCMTQILLADEINRTSPKTQSSLLEIMQEGQVTVDSVTYMLPKPFMVLATQNPIDFVGTYQLPEAQMDRFFMRINIGYPSLQEEVDLLSRHEGTSQPLDAIGPVCSADEILSMQEMVGRIYSSVEAKTYIASIVQNTRSHPSLALGASTRGSIALLHAAQALALLNGRDYVLPDDIKRMAKSVLSHRIVLTPEASIKNIKQEDIIGEVLAATPIPGKIK